MNIIVSACVQKWKKKSSVHTLDLTSGLSNRIRDLIRPSMMVPSGAVASTAIIENGSTFLSPAANINRS